MKYLVAIITFIVVFIFFVGLALGWVYAGTGSIEFGTQLQGALYIGMSLGLLGGVLSGLVIMETLK